MNIEQIYTKCLAQGSYYITSGDEAVVIDPLRETEPYIERAKNDGVKIKYILETHFHADFVSGHYDLAKETGATIVFGPNEANIGKGSYTAKDEEILKVGKIKIKVIHTPGHTPESSCYLLIDENGNEKAIFTGDTLFIGDVGRPDLAQKLDDYWTEDKLARALYNSLRNKILPLDDNLIVYPAHGAGSACGKSMSKETFDTLGNQKKYNYALQEMTEDEFVEQVTDGLTQPPKYFPENVLLNINGYDDINSVIKNGSKALSLDEFIELESQDDVMVLDTRKPQDFAVGHIPNSMFIGIDGTFAVWVGTVIENINQKILIIAEDGREREVAMRLARVGYDNSLGHLSGGIDTWKSAGKDIATIKSIPADEFSEINRNEDINILDVRKENEYISTHIEDAQNVALDYIYSNLHKISKDNQYYIHCAGGYRSMIFSSILKSKGFNDIIDIQGGFNAIKNTEKFKLTEFVCPSTL